MEQKKLFEVADFQENQKQLLASQTIESAGTSIIQQDPIEIAVLPFMRDKVCNYCLTPKDKLSKCGSCKTFYYCSMACQKKDWPVHKKECPIYTQIKKKDFKLTSQFVLMLRIYLKNKGKIIDNVMINHSNFPEQNIKFFQESAFVVLKYLEEDQTEEKISTLVQINMQIFLNAFTIQDPLYTYEGIAIGIYENAHYINHSCLPNCVQIFVDRKIHIKSLKKIEKGEPITISYFDVCKPRSERQKYTKENYMFICECSRCLNDPSETQSFIKCEKCKDTTYDIQTLKCDKCQKSITPEKVQQIENRIIEIQKKMYQPDLPYNEKVNLITEARNTVFMKDPKFCSIISNFIIYSIQKEQYRNAALFMKTYIKNFKHWYGQDLPLLFTKYNELSKLLFYENQLLKAEKYTTEALKLSKIFYTDMVFPELMELKQRYQDIQHEIMMNK